MELFPCAFTRCMSPRKHRLEPSSKQTCEGTGAALPGICKASRTGWLVTLSWMEFCVTGILLFVSLILRKQQHCIYRSHSSCRKRQPPDLYNLSFGVLSQSRTYLSLLEVDCTWHVVKSSSSNALRHSVDSL